MIYKYEDIKQIHLEPTQRCNAACPMCDRNNNGGDVNHFLNNHDISLNDIKKMLPTEFINQLNSIIFCGNHGDPGLCPELIPICKYLKSVNPKLFLSVTTNGGMRKPSWWAELAGTVDIVTFSVDGLEDTNHLYRQNVQWNRLESNMEAYSDAGGRANWTFLVFNYNEHQVESARIYAKLLNFDFTVKKSGRYINTYSLTKRNQHQAFDKKGNRTQLLSQPFDPKYHNKELSKFDKIVEQYGSFDKFIDVAEISCKAIPKKEIYISAEGFVFPCCWLGGQPYKFWRPELGGDVYKMLGDLNNINSKLHSIKDIIEGRFFEAVENSWGIKGCSNGRIKTCGLKCNKGFDPFSAQWK